MEPRVRTQERRVRMNLTEGPKGKFLGSGWINWRAWKRTEDLSRNQDGYVSGFEVCFERMERTVAGPGL
jgi:hypothetical protein